MKTCCNKTCNMSHINHKTLRGPRGGLILCNNEYLIKKLNSAVFPGTQGGPLKVL